MINSESGPGAMFNNRPVIMNSSRSCVPNMASRLRWGLGLPSFSQAAHSRLYAFSEHNKKPAEAGFFSDHSNILSVAIRAMVDHP
ncbi:MAG TPA: hypothetical protein VLG17_10330 [Pseudomonas sp.]|uniref:hypothetical protein n=1 Tax=Pseudomonas sp. TaxID=306 RepID=UPI002C9A62BC|nr:hypothetical protein [Pseudomonas sp.]HSX88385.1 hypothetical protein [Pseudomonas sp.]